MCRLRWKVKSSHVTGPHLSRHEGIYMMSSLLWLGICHVTKVNVIFDIDMSIHQEERDVDIDISSTYISHDMSRNSIPEPGTM